MSRIDSYRVQGTIISFAELAKKKPDIAVAATTAQIDELELHGKQVAAREAAGAHYAARHPDQIHAQIVADGKVVATVYRSGTTVTQRDISGLELSETGQGVALAQTRLAELLQAVPGKVIYSDFQAPPMPPSSNLPDPAVPAVTARGLTDMVRDMDWSLARARMAVDPQPK